MFNAAMENIQDWVGALLKNAIDGRGHGWCRLRDGERPGVGIFLPDTISVGVLSGGSRISSGECKNRPSCDNNLLQVFLCIQTLEMRRAF